MRNLKLRPTITIVLTVGFLLPVLLVGWLTLLDQRKTLQKDLNDDHDRILKILALGIQEPLWSLYPEAGRPLVNAMMADRRIEQITVESEDGVFLETIRTGSNHKAIQSRSTPVFFHGRKIGKATIVMDNSHLSKAFAAQSNKFLLTLLVPFLISLIFLFFLLLCSMLVCLKIDALFLELLFQLFQLLVVFPVLLFKFFRIHGPAVFCDQPSVGKLFVQVGVYLVLVYLLDLQVSVVIGFVIGLLHVEGILALQEPVASQVVLNIPKKSIRIRQIVLGFVRDRAAQKEEK